VWQGTWRDPQGAAIQPWCQSFVLGRTRIETRRIRRLLPDQNRIRAQDLGGSGFGGQSNQVVVENPPPVDLEITHEPL
jgi:hypothetical protein